MDRIIPWKRMRYGTGERDTERYMGFLLVCVCAAIGEKGSSLRSSKLIKNLNQKLFELTINKLTLQLWFMIQGYDTILTKETL